MQCFRAWLRAKTINGFCLERREKGKVQSRVGPNANSLFECMCLCVVLTAINNKLFSYLVKIVPCLRIYFENENPF